jgi:hypothetical protein
MTLHYLNFTVQVETRLIPDCDGVNDHWTWLAPYGESSCLNSEDEAVNDARNYFEGILEE